MERNPKMNSSKPHTDKYFLLNVVYKKQDLHKVDSSESLIHKSNTEYFVHLVHTALADGVISDNELQILRHLSKRLGISLAETDYLINLTVKGDHNPPSDLLSRFEQVFEIVNMILADGSIEKNEMHLASGFAAKCGFNEMEIPDLLVLLSNGIGQGNNKAELFKEYQNRLKL